MAGKKKTIDVQFILDYSNRQLARTDADATKEFKEGIIAILGRVLLDTGNYNGFHFLNNDDSTVNTLGHVSRKYF